MRYYSWSCPTCGAGSQTRKDTVQGAVRTKLQARQHAKDTGHPTRWEQRDRETDRVEMSASYPEPEPQTEAEVFRGF